ncbi:MAG: universal stress protein [Aeromicrobium sp.]
MTRPGTRPVVVGLLGDQPGLLDHAVGWARALDAPLRVVHAWAIPLNTAEDFEARELEGTFRSAAQGVLEGARIRLERHDDLAISYEMSYGAASSILDNEGRTAALVVLGTDNTGWLGRVLGGAVARHVALHAEAPVVVVPPDVAWVAPHLVVLAIDEPRTAPGPATFALDVAMRSGAELEVVHVVDGGVAVAQRRAVLTDLDRWLEELRVAHPEVPMSTRLVAGGVADETAVASRDAQLVVLGRPREHHLPLFDDRSIAATMLRRTRCPVAVVPVAFEAVASS